MAFRKMKIAFIWCDYATHSFCFADQWSSIQSLGDSLEGGCGSNLTWQRRKPCVPYKQTVTKNSCPKATLFLVFYDWNPYLIRTNELLILKQYKYARLRNRRGWHKQRQSPISLHLLSAKRAMQNASILRNEKAGMMGDSTSGSHASPQRHKVKLQTPFLLCNPPPLITLYPTEKHDGDEDRGRTSRRHWKSLRRCFQGPSGRGCGRHD
jgi:hypothetical protein